MAKINQEARLLNMLKSVLPKAVPDPKLAQQIYSAFEKEITTTERATAFEKFCKHVELPDLDKKTIMEVKKQFEASFGAGNVSIVPHPEKEAASVEIVTPEATFEGVVKVGEVTPEEEEGGEKAKFVPFPVAMESDPELVWLMARDERIAPNEALVVLAKAQDTFWESKSGQLHLRKRVERTFPEFMAKVPGKMLTEVGLKRHYKEPEALKQVKPLKARKQDKP